MSFSNNSRFGKKNNKVNLDNLACCQRRVLTNWWRVNDVLNYKISLFHQLTKRKEKNQTANMKLTWHLILIRIKEQWISTIFNFRLFKLSGIYSNWYFDIHCKYGFLFYFCQDVDNKPMTIERLYFCSINH